jgi:hypothetical protein
VKETGIIDGCRLFLEMLSPAFVLLFVVAAGK